MKTSSKDLICDDFLDAFFNKKILISVVEGFAV